MPAVLKTRAGTNLPRPSRVFLLATLAAFLLLSTSSAASAYELAVSTSSNRSNAAALEGSHVAGNIFVFTRPDTGVSKVAFYLDDPDRNGSPFQVENRPAYDFAGTAGNGTANPFLTAILPNGSHTITAVVTKTDTTSEVLTALFTVDNEVAGPSGYDLLVSASANRSAAEPLDGGEVAKEIYVFTDPDQGVSGVGFWLDDPEMKGTPTTVENRPRYDFAGTAGNGNAQPFFTTSLANGPHTITALVSKTDATSALVTAEFDVDNEVTGPSGYDLLVSAAADRSAAEPLDGSEASGNIHVFTDPDKGVSSVSFWLDDPERSGAPRQVEGKPRYDFAGTNKDGTAVSFDTRTLENGTHTITAAITETTGPTAIVQGTFEVVNTETKDCGPLPCTEALVDELPYRLEFSDDQGGIEDANGVGTGFTYLETPEKAKGYVPSLLDVDTAASQLRVNSTNGLNSEAANSQDNALGVGIDAPSQKTAISTMIVEPPAGTGRYEQAGVWFGNDQDSFDKLVVMSTRGGTKIQHLLEVGGTHIASTDSPVLSLSGTTVTLTIVADPSTRKLSAFYRVGLGVEIMLGSYEVTGEFFSFDAAGIDPTIGTRSFGGILTSNRNSPTPLTYGFDWFSVSEDQRDTSSPSDPVAPEIQFERSTFPLSMPTSMAWGPDGRLYVLELFGTIHALTLDPDYNVVDDEVIDSLGTRLALGLEVDPLSTSEHVILWASHSSPSLNDGVPNSGIVSRLEGPSFAERTDILTGLPRAKANHATNSIHFGPDGRLYIAQGGNTGAGAPNTANTEFGSMEEQPLSAAMLVADVRSSGFDGSCANTTDIFGPPPCDVEVYSSGLRNTYDFVWHTNGRLYGPDNGLGVQGSFPPSPTAPCFGLGSTASWTTGGNNPGDQPDILNILEPGRYYGHPNPYREECVFKDGTYQGAPAPLNYKPPLRSLGLNRSSDGTIEYLADGFCRDLEGDLLIANYSVGDDLTRIVLSEDGQSVLSTSSLTGGFNDPLPLAQSPDGTIFVGELGAGRITALKPIDIGCWGTAPPAPEAVLDAGGTALGGKIYLVGGKTSAGHRSSARVFDPQGGSWSAATDLPGPAVENPAVVPHDGKLYAFGGSTSPFSGAVGNAASFDPATGEWTLLPPMPTARGGVAASVVDGKIYLIGGLDDSGASLSTVEIFDPQTESWTSGPALGTRRDNPAAATLEGRLYVFGGRTRNSDGSSPGPTLSSVEMLDPAVGSWVQRAPMPTGRRTMAVGRLNGRAQLMGGEIRANGDAFSENEEYDPATNTWRTLHAMTTGRHGAVAGTVDGKVYVIGGGDTGGTAFTALNEVFSFQE